MTPAAPLLVRAAPADLVRTRHEPVDAATLAAASEIVADVRARGALAVRHHAERLGDLAPGSPMIRTRDQLQSALASLPAAQRELLTRIAARIRRFASAQRSAIKPLTLAVPGGRAGHTIAPVDAAGCYAPGGRFPLPSSVLMTALTARCAGVRTVVVASPNPAPITLAAAAVAGADCLLAVGGAHAIAALTFGIESENLVIPACPAIVGPGNRWVTAAKQLVAGRVAIDSLAGPSELLVIADDSTDPALIAADLLAQAEHDPDASVVLLALHEPLIDAVNRALADQLAALPTAATARAALAHSSAVFCASPQIAAELSDALAPEHLQVMTRDAAALASQLNHYGAIFIGSASAEVLGDYGIGPNHVLPTSGSAVSFGGLSVFNFLRIRTFLHVSHAGEARAVAADSALLARLEGLEAHARAADRRS